MVDGILPMLGLAVAGQAPYLAVIKWLVNQYESEKKSRHMIEKARLDEAKGYIQKSHEIVLKLDQFTSELHNHNESLVNKMVLLKDDFKEYIERLERKFDKHDH